MTRAHWLAVRGDARSTQGALNEARAAAVAAGGIGMRAVERRATELALSLRASTTTST
jgi:hypothetical protein